MATLNQSYSRKLFYNSSGKKYVNPSWGRAPILNKCPQAKGIVTSVTTMSPNNTNLCDKACRED